MGKNNNNNKKEKKDKKEVKSEAKDKKTVKERTHNKVVNQLQRTRDDAQSLGKVAGLRFLFQTNLHRIGSLLVGLGNSTWYRRP